MEFSARGGSRPLRASGTRFVAHKVAALGRFIDKYGAQHLHSLDRQKLNGHVKKWRDSKILLGCAVFRDILKPSAQLCKILQEDNACIVRAIEAIMKTMSQLKSSSFEDLPCVKKVMSRIVKVDTDSTVKYQQVELSRYDEGVVFLNSHYKDYCSSTTDCLRGRIKIQGIANRRTKLGQDRLDNLMRIKVEGPALSEWDATRSFEL